jgi:hypothetical protein
MADSQDFLQTSYRSLRQAVAARDTGTPLPSASALQTGRESLPSILQDVGRGPEETVKHIITDIVPALNNASLSSRYFGFVIGGALPVAEAADNIVSALDQNVHNHMPNDTICTDVEDSALRLLIDLLGLGSSDDWPSRVFTTGATASNILGLTCGREAVVGNRLAGSSGVTVAKAGLLGACLAAGVKRIQVLTSGGHSSLVKAASIVGIGHDEVKELPLSESEPWRLDLDAVERELTRDEGVVSIISVSAGEVNTGRFATNALDMPKLRSLADKYGAWIHVDGGTYSGDRRRSVVWANDGLVSSFWYIRQIAAGQRGIPDSACSDRRSGAGRQYHSRRAQDSERCKSSSPVGGFVRRLHCLICSSPMIQASSSAATQP